MSTAEQVSSGELQSADTQIQAAAQIQGGDSTRISVFNFDPVEQSKLWLQLGPVEANRVLVGVLRTALLFGGTVVVDRNQLLEGIFFVAMPPDRLAWHLGLEPGAQLPLEVQLLPPRTGPDVPPRPVAPPGPWTLEDGGPSWGVEDEVLLAIEANHADVSNGSDRVSSPQIALTGGNYDRGADADPLLSHSASAALTTDAWKQTDPVLLPQTVWEKHDRTVAKAVREQGRRAWMEAMRTGRVQVHPATNMGPNPVGSELVTELPPNPEGQPVVDQLVRELINLHLAGTPADASCNAGHQDESTVCTGKHVTTRSLVTRWLDGEKVPALNPPQLPGHLRRPELAVHRSAALGWWTLAYNRAICSRDNLRLLTIYNALPSPSGVLGEEAAAAELAWGLTRPKPAFGARMRARLRRLRRSTTNESGTLPIAGDIVTRLAAFTPAQYSRLQAFDAVGSEALLRNPGRSSLFDLVVAIDEIAGDTTSRSRRMKATMLRGAVFGTGGLAVVLYDNEVIALSGPTWSVVAVVAAALLAAPWSDLGALRRMSGSQLQSTLRMSDDNA